MKKVYIAKTDLPGGCHAGRQIILENLEFRYKDTGEPCPYDCAKETRFFELVPEPKFQIGSKMILAKPLSAVIRGMVSRTFKLPAYTEMEIVGEVPGRNGKVQAVVKYNGREYLIPEISVLIPTKYYYVSSTGGVFPEFVGRNPKHDAYREKVGNYHKSAEDANAYKKQLMS